MMGWTHPNLKSRPPAVKAEQISVDPVPAPVICLRDADIDAPAVTGHARASALIADAAMTVPALLVAALILFLLLHVVWIGFHEASNGVFTASFGLRNYTALLSDGLVLRALVNTLLFAVIALAVAAAIGLPMAWLVERTDLPGKAAVWTLATTGLLLPGFFTAMGWLFLLHPRIGMVNRLFRQWFGADLPITVVSVPGMGWVEGLILAPLFFLMTAGSFAAMDPRLEEAARMSGAGAWSRLRRITAPLLLPAVAAAAIYSFSIAIGAFDVPATIGLSNRILMFSTLLYLKVYPQEGYPDYGLPAAFGSLTLLVAIGLGVLYVRVLRQARRYQIVGGKGAAHRRVRLGRWVVLAWGFIALYAVMAELAPLLLIVWAAFLPFFMPPSAQAMKLLTLANFHTAPWDLVLRGLENTAILVAVVPAAIVALSLCVSWTVLRSRLPGRLALDTVVFLPHALPSIVFSLSAVIIALFLLGNAVPLYGSLGLIAIVYVTFWISFGTRSVNSALIHVHPELEEAAAMAGASRLVAMRRVLVPLLRPTLLGTWLWLALLCFNELTMAILLFSPRAVTLPVIAYTLWLGGKLNHAAVVTLTIIVLCTPLVLVYFRFGRRWRAAQYV
jgi:iron(III) transport system permease protein